jgi:hypothetical protein
MQRFFVSLYDKERLTSHFYHATLEPDGFVAKFQHLLHGMRNKQHRASRTHQFLNPNLGFSDEIRVASTQHFIDDQDIWANGSRGGEHQTRLHSKRVGLERLIEKIPEFTKLDDPVHGLLVIRPAESVVLKGSLDVLAPSVFGMKSQTNIH